MARRGEARRQKTLADEGSRSSGTASAAALYGPPHLALPFVVSARRVRPFLRSPVVGQRHEAAGLGGPSLPLVVRMPARCGGSREPASGAGGERARRARPQPDRGEPRSRGLRGPPPERRRAAPERRRAGGASGGRTKAITCRLRRWVGGPGRGRQEADAQVGWLARCQAGHGTGRAGGGVPVQEQGVRSRSLPASPCLACHRAVPAAHANAEHKKAGAHRRTLLLGVTTRPESRPGSRSGRRTA